jgi:pyroglutamyl-peptidase
MSRRTLVTGFLPFGPHRVNPSALLAETSGRPFELLEVSYAAVDRFLDSVHARRHAFDRLLMLGLRGSGAAIEIERLARNLVGPDPDVRGEVRGPGLVEPDAPQTISETLFGPSAFSAASWSDDAGCYLCNYVFYRALRRLPDKRVGFVHVPPHNVIPFPAQQLHIARLIESAETEAAPAPAPASD